jgi:hypothetical protein
MEKSVDQMKCPECTAPGITSSLCWGGTLAWHPYGRGRGGERLGMLVAITQRLVEAALQVSAAKPQS